ncbi:eukaryotic translation initiation factor 2 subunit 2-like isoform X2 [Amphiura filiformis]|uniref:eukaryotic translation initiation factor 2 subunit 2-like isoform X2 n=1 Tax=Amphiura filiformis TaxID=82378 RepID=UPI003B218C57
MTEEDAFFDPTMKKKKKKKKMPMDLDAALEGQPGGDKPEESTDGVTQSKPAAVPEPAADPEPTQVPQEEEPAKDIDLDLEDFGNLKKKKKKKKKTFDMDGLDDALREVESTPASENIETSQDGTGMPDVIPADLDTDLDFTLTKKKKKKKKPKIEDVEAEMENGEAEEMPEDDDKQTKDTSGTAWAGTERDYTYDELLNRVFDIMRAKNPDMVTGEKKRFVMRPPQVVRVGTKKSSFVNFTDICKMLHRPTEHLLAFLLAELGTSGSIDGNNQLIIKGRFQQKQIESVLRRYIKEYVTCHTCRSSETFLHKENRLFFLQCERCQSRCSVASIKSGFQALTGKRAQMRAKAN